MLTLQITRISSTHHRFAYSRADGSGESSDLETKTFLQHDFLHFALESEAHISFGFYGLLAAGHTLAELNESADSTMDQEVAGEVERAVGVFTGMLKSESAPESGMAMLQNIWSAYGKPVPEWLTPETLAHAAECYRKVVGEWNSLKFGETLELRFNP